MMGYLLAEKFTSLKSYREHFGYKKIDDLMSYIRSDFINLVYGQGFIQIFSAMALSTPTQRPQLPKP